MGVSFSWGDNEDDPSVSPQSSLHKPPTTATSNAIMAPRKNLSVDPQAHLKFSSLTKSLVPASSLSLTKSSSLQPASRPLSDPLLSVARSSASEEFLFRGSISPPGAYGGPSSAAHAPYSPIAPPSPVGGGHQLRRRSLGTPCTSSPRHTDDHDTLSSLARASVNSAAGSATAVQRSGRASDGEVAIDSRHVPRSGLGKQLSERTNKVSIFTLTST